MVIPSYSYAVLQPGVFSLSDLSNAMFLKLAFIVTYNVNKAGTVCCILIGCDCHLQCLLLIPNVRLCSVVPVTANYLTRRKQLAFSSTLSIQEGCLEAIALSPVSPRVEFRRPCVAEALKGHSVLLMEGGALLGSQMGSEDDLAPHAADVLQVSESLR